MLNLWPFLRTLRYRFLSPPKSFPKASVCLHVSPWTLSASEVCEIGLGGDDTEACMRVMFSSLFAPTFVCQFLLQFTNLMRKGSCSLRGWCWMWGGSKLVPKGPAYAVNSGVLHLVVVCEDVIIIVACRGMLLLLMTLESWMVVVAGIFPFCQAAFRVCFRVAFKPPWSFGCIAAVVIMELQMLDLSVLLMVLKGTNRKHWHGWWSGGPRKTINEKINTHLKTKKRGYIRNRRNGIWKRCFMSRLQWGKLTRDNIRRILCGDHLQVDGFWNSTLAKRLGSLATIKSAFLF